MRWQAIEGFNSAPGLSPLVRRLGIALICSMDAKTRNCFPGELRLAAELGSHLVSIKKAKVELREAGLITWFNPGGPRHLSHYGFTWSALTRHATEASERAKLAVESSQIHRRKGSPQATMTPRPQGSPTATIEQPTTSFQGSQNEFQGSQNEAQGSRGATAKVAVGLPELSLYLPSLSTQPHHALAGGGGREEKNSASPIEGKKEEAREEKKAVGIFCMYPRVLEVFKDEPETAAAFLALDGNWQASVSRVMAMKGREAARAILLPKANDHEAQP